MEFEEIESGIGSTSEVEDSKRLKTQITFDFEIDTSLRGTRENKKIFTTRWKARPVNNGTSVFEIFSDKNYKIIGSYSTEDAEKLKRIINESRTKFNNYASDEINYGNIKKFDFRYFPEDYYLHLLHKMAQYLATHK